MPYATSSCSSDEDTHHHIAPSDLNPANTYKIYISASGRLYHTPFGSASHVWSYSQLKGLLVFGRDRLGTAHRDGTASIQHASSSDGEKFWFRLVDVLSGKTVWLFKVPTGLDYRIEKPFFHVFSGKSRMFGFRFDDDDEAAEFFKNVVDRASIKLIATNKDAKKHKPSLSLHKGPISTSMISAPTPESFVHQGHVGLNKDGVIEVSGNLDPTWRAVIGELQGYGISQRMVDKNLDFVEGFLEGAKSAQNNFRLSGANQTRKGI